MEVRNCVMVLAVLFLVSGCFLGFAPPPTSSYTIKVMFNTSTECPVSTDPATLDAKRADNVAWQSYDKDNTSTTFAADYDIYFDPFRGQPISSNKNTGAVAGRPVDNKTPEDVEFKYTIVGNDCTTGTPLDPHIKILK